MDRNDQILAVVFLGAMVFFGLLAIANSHDHGTAAEWAAAVGTISAVFAALWTAGQALRYERDRNNARARICAFYLAPIVISINNRAELASEYGEARNYGLEDAPNPNFSVDVARRLLINVEIPREAFADLWALPSTLARDCIRLDAFVRQYQQLTEENIPRLRLMNAQQRGMYVEAMATSLTNLRAISTRARAALTALSDGV